MEVFKEAWYSIDLEAKGSINAEDLAVYMRKNNYEEAFVKKWMAIFDQDNSGTIELEEYCEVLGLNEKEMMEETRLRAKATGMPEGVEYIAGDMSEERQIDIARLCIEALEKHSSLKEVPKWVKLEADKQFDRVWHVLAIRGQFWCYFGFEPETSYVFRYKRNVFIIWKTPRN
ncbi:hypothetical protein BOX15_Mlig014838g1 [Macrostomum lignano]|uniref:EF-hand domain-containing protein n=1 Tax=Macrostomum lignano TaxID=282301 RepID=A0A267GBS0_9PLAT|nr:hypothetical protein BOX15_Mlig026248g2 [Macrostomum lignano]PAA83478.1 hypothetical protein BOX15_Mlig014838g1 [Macrostomum lignano]